MAALAKPRAVIILVQAGKPVDDTIALLASVMEPGDLIIDGGNEWFPNTLRRGTELAAKELLFMGMGVSGGEDGARHGPSLMPGGPRAAYDMVKDVLELIAAKVRACAGADSVLTRLAFCATLIVANLLLRQLATASPSRRRHLCRLTRAPA